MFTVDSSVSCLNLIPILFGFGESYRHLRSYALVPTYILVILFITYLPRVAVYPRPAHWKGMIWEISPDTNYVFMVLEQLYESLIWFIVHNFLFSLIINP